MDEVAWTRMPRENAPYALGPLLPWPFTPDACRTLAFGEMLTPLPPSSCAACRPTRMAEASHDIVLR